MKTGQGKTREEVQAEVDAINRMAKENRAQVLPCRDCAGQGYRSYAIFGDPRLGFEQERCYTCQGTGNRLKFRR